MARLLDRIGDHEQFWLGFLAGALAACGLVIAFALL
jgi:hypothetical protein